jgi:large subunit ribosomal protein L15
MENIMTKRELYTAIVNGTEITEEVLLKAGLVAKNKAPLKVLGTGDVNKALKVKAQKFSASAKAKIEAAGGSVEVIE